MHYGAQAAVLGGIDQYFNRDIVVIHGKAPGADVYADKWAKSVGHEPLVFPADWDVEPRRAGYIRNQQMLDEGKPDVVWAFVNKPLEDSDGTKMMVDIACTGGVPCYVVERISPLNS